MVRFFYQIPVNCSAEQLWQVLIDKIKRPEVYISGVTSKSFQSTSDGRILRIMERNDLNVKEIIHQDKQQMQTRFDLKDHPQYGGFIENTIVKEDETTYLTYALEWQAHTGKEDPVFIKTWFEKAVWETKHAAESWLETGE